MRILLGLFFSAALPLFLSALPSGESVHRGKVQFDRQEGQFKVHASDGSIIHYENFDVSQNEKVEFIQPGSSSRVLNRIESAIPSHINGQMRANGIVYLMNPAGVIFGPNSIIDVGKFFAGAARIRDEDFLAKRDSFFDIRGEVINSGLLKGKEVHLIGANVDNQGRIETADGVVTLLSGGSILIGEKGSNFYVSIESEELSGIGAADLVGYAIHQRGSIAAKEVHIEGDRVLLDGKIDASGKKGGIIRVLGDEIQLQSAQIDAKGKRAGGTVLIGGDYKGQGPLRQSKKTLMDEGSRIDVSATNNGNGGKAILWSERMTFFDGNITACGGVAGGNGGLVETSGRQSLGSEKGRVDARAPRGKTGDWLLDPLSITVVASGGTGTLVQAANCADAVTVLTINNTVINAALANVVLCASTTVIQNLGAPINIAAAGVGITFEATTSTTIDDNVTTNGGNIIATTSSTTINAATLSSGSGDITLADLLVGVGSPGVTLQVGSGTLNVNGTTILSNTLTLVSTAGGGLNTQDISCVVPNTQNLIINGGSTGAVSIGGALSVNAVTVTNSLLTTFVNTTTANTVTLTNTATQIEFGLDVTIGTITTTTNPYKVIFDTGGTVTNAATFFNTGGVQLGTFSGSSITFTGGLNTNQTGVTTSTFGTVSTTGTPMTLGPVVLLGDTTMNTSNGALTFNSTVTGAHNLTVNTGTTAPAFIGAVSIGDVVGNTSLTINTTGVNTVFSNTLTTVGGLTSNDNVVFNNNVSVGGVVSLPSLTTSTVPLAAYNVAFLGGGTVTAFTQFFNTGTVTFGSPSLPTLTFTNGVNTSAGPSSTIVQGTVQVTTASAPLIFGATTFAAGNDTLTTNDGIMTLGNVTLTGNATLQTGGGNLTVGNVNGAGNFSTSSGSTGTTTIASLVCNIFAPSNSLSVLISGTTTASVVNLTGMNNGQSVTFNGLVNISTSFFTSSASYAVIFNAGGTVTPFTNFFNTGGVTFGNSSSSDILFTNGVNTFNPGVTTNTFGTVRSTSGPITIGTLILNGNTSIQNTNNPITFASTINGAFGLNVFDAGGTATFDGIVGGTTPLSSLTVSASAIDLEANATVSGGAISMNGPVVLSSAIVLTDTGGGISFSSTIDGFFALTLNTLSQGNVSVSGSVGGITPLASLTVNAASAASFASINTTGPTGFNGGPISIVANGPVVCSGSITALGSSSASNGFNGGNVSISSTGNSVTVGQINVSGGSGGSLPGGNSGAITLQPTNSFSTGHDGNFPRGILQIFGSLTALGGGGSSSGSAGTISLSPAGRSTTMSIATITSNPSGGDLVVQAGNLFIGPNEAVTAIGSVSFSLQNTIAVGDVVALNAITISASTIEILLHQPGEILNNLGILYPNSRVHFISRDPSLTGSIVLVGSGPSPLISTVDLSYAEFRSLLFYGSIVLNFDGSGFAIAGIIDWVLRADTFWDTTPLTSLMYWKQFLAKWIDLALHPYPNLTHKWLWIKKRGARSVEQAMAKYRAMKNLQEGIISIPDFAIYLHGSSGNEEAKKTIANVQALLSGAKQLSEGANNGVFYSMGTFLKKERQIPPSQSPMSSQYFKQDVLEFTKPPSLSLDQWSQLVLPEKNNLGFLSVSSI